MMCYPGYNTGHFGHKLALNLTKAVRTIRMKSAEEKTMTEGYNYIARNNSAYKIEIPMVERIDYKNLGTVRMGNFLEH